MADKAKEKMGIVTSHDVTIDKEYIQWISDIKRRYRNAQIKTAVKVNSEQLLFNWQLGRDLVIRRAEEKWGKGVVEQLSLDLQREFPEVKGFSTRNLWLMKQWYSFYAINYNATGLIEQLEKSLNVSGEKLHQVSAEMAFPSIFSYVPWKHHILIISKCKTIEKALFYIKRTVEEGLSRNALDNSIRADMYHSLGSAVTNFKERLPFPQGELADEL